MRYLTHAVWALSGGDRLSHLLIGLITDRLRIIKQRFDRLAARIEAGTYVPRRCGPRRKSLHRRPRTPSKLPTHRGWLVPLLPQAVEIRGHLDGLLQYPDMAALVAAAPPSMRRSLRSLCWMLRLAPPPILKPPSKPRPPRKTPPAPKPPPPEQSQPPAWMPRHKRWSLARIRGSPPPAQGPPRRN